MQKQLPLVDLHCDLLSFLADHPSSWIEDPRSNASYPQLRQGGVSLQTLAIFTYSDAKAHESAKKQFSILTRLLQEHPEKFALWDPKISLKTPKEPLLVIPSIENAYSLCEENAPISQGIAFLETILHQFHRVLYISLTWNGENRFGGGCGSNTGLKEDGKRLLEFLHRKKIAIDLSHASDFLADDILNFLEKKSLDIPVMASHSNARLIASQERNLPDLIAKEIFRRKGIIGLNFFAPFIGPQVEYLAKHVDHFFSLGGEKNLCFGADFFHLPSFSYLQEKYQTETGFFPNLANASCYPYALFLLEKELGKKGSQIQSIASQNFQDYVERTFI